MWNLLALYDDKKSPEGKLVSIITQYYDPENKVICLIAVDDEGNFINSDMGDFKSQNRKGFLTDQPTY